MHAPFTTHMGPNGYIPRNENWGSRCVHFSLFWARVVHGCVLVGQVFSKAPTQGNLDHTQFHYLLSKHV